MSGRAIYELMRGVAVKEGTNPTRVERNTMQYVATDGTFRTRLHDTDILILSADGHHLTFNTGGFDTRTTRDRMNRYSIGCVRVYRVRGESIVTLGRKRWPLKRGLEINIPAMRALDTRRYRREKLENNHGRDWVKSYESARRTARKESSHAR